jgi:ribosomal subunit interface protein
MQIKTKATNIVLNSEIEDYLSKKIDSVSKILTDNDNLLFEVELGRTTNHHQTGDIFRAEINLSFDGNHFRAESENADLYSAIDEARDDISNALRSFKNKKKTWVKRSGAKLKDFIRKFYK